MTVPSYLLAQQHPGNREAFSRFWTNLVKPRNGFNNTLFHTTFLYSPDLLHQEHNPFKSLSLKSLEDLSAVKDGWPRAQQTPSKLLTPRTGSEEVFDAIVKTSNAVGTPKEGEAKSSLFKHPELR